jgi:hypothetical protein
MAFGRERKTFASSDGAQIEQEIVESGAGIEVTVHEARPESGADIGRGKNTVDVPLDADGDLDGSGLSVLVAFSTDDGTLAVAHPVD